MRGRRDDAGASVRPVAEHRITVTVRGEDLVDVLDALCVLEECEVGELATKVLVERLLRVQAEDPDVQELVRARRRRRRRRWLHVVEPAEGGWMGVDEVAPVPMGHPRGRVRSATMESRSRSLPGPKLVEEG